MPTPRPWADAREVDRVELLVTVDDAARAEDFLASCVVGSSWTARIRTAEVTATVLARRPLGTIDERTCTCLSLRLALPVPVEPSLRFRLSDEDDDLTATGLVRPWDD